MARCEPARRGRSLMPTWNENDRRSRRRPFRSAPATEARFTKLHTRSGVHSRVLCALLPVEHLPDADRPPCSPPCSADRRKRSQQ